jgi:hypothetical protein
VLTSPRYLIRLLPLLQERKEAPHIAKLKWLTLLHEGEGVCQTGNNQLSRDISHPRQAQGSPC